MLGEVVTIDLHSGNDSDRIREESHCHTLKKTYDIPFNNNMDQNRTTKRLHRFRQLKFGATILLSFFSTLYITQKRSRRTESLIVTKSMKTKLKTDRIIVKEPDLIYRCPATTLDDSTGTSMEHKLRYDSLSAKISNVKSFMETFRQVEFDNWGHTYDEVKHGMYSWKSQYFKDLKSNDIIYESASGIGMNLYMTLEIMQQVSGITNITIYGNDYVARSVQIAQDIYGNSGKSNHMLPSSFGRLGSICEADSTQLDFIPSNTFDLVYTGYISPLFDPLQLNQSTTDENFVQYNAYCEQNQQNDKGDSATLAEQAQQVQNDWYGKWVGEMIRIAKPGAPVIVEQVSYPYVSLLSLRFILGVPH